MTNKIFKSILFLGIIPCDAALFTMFKNPELGSKIVLCINIIVCFLAFVKMIRQATKSNANNRMALTIIGLFLIMITFNILASLLSGENIPLGKRFMSMVCVCAYYVYSIYYFKDTHTLIKSINGALLFLIMLGYILSYIDFENVSYVENATTRTFKGLASNRNSYSEITLFYIATNMYLWVKNKQNGLFYFATTALALYTTFMTGSATSSVCAVLLISLCIIYTLTKKTIPLKFMLIVYLFFFVMMIVMQSENVPFLREIQEYFNKDSGMTGRQNIWKVSWLLIEEHLLLGRGFDTEVLLNIGIRENDTHNGVLYILLTQGIVGFSILLYTFYKVLHNIKLSFETNKMNVYLYIFVIVWLIRGLTESCFTYTHFVFWIALICIKKNMNSMYDSRRNDIDEKQQIQQRFY